MAEACAAVASWFRSSCHVNSLGAAACDRGNSDVMHAPPAAPMPQRRGLFGERSQPSRKQAGKSASRRKPSFHLALLRHCCPLLLLLLLPLQATCCFYRQHATATGDVLLPRLILANRQQASAHAGERLVSVQASTATAASVFQFASSQGVRQQPATKQPLETSK